MMKGSGWGRHAAILACVAVFVAGGLMVYRAVFTSPPPTPTPGQDLSVSADDARAGAFDDLLPIPDGSFGPFVGLEPIQVPLPGNPPNHLYIPSLRVSAPIVPQGITQAGAMALPDDLSRVGWLETTSGLDADSGSTLIAGHVTSRGIHGALYFLGLSEPGMSVTTVDDQQEHTRWVVTSVHAYRKTSLPPQIFATDGDRTLTLVTCGGKIIRTPDGRWTHEDNIVVVAVPEDPEA